MADIRDVESLRNYLFRKADDDNTNNPYKMARIHAYRDAFERLLASPIIEAEPICSICKSSATGFDFKPLKHTEERKNCPMRHENGNCLAMGGFCLAVNNEICHGLHNAYNEGVEAEPIKHGVQILTRSFKKDEVEEDG